MYFLDSMFGWVGAALIGALPGLILSVLVWIHRTELVDHRVKARAAAAQHGTTSMLALFLQPAILLCLVYFALLAANTVGIQQFAVPAWTSNVRRRRKLCGALPDRLHRRFGGRRAGGWHLRRPGAPPRPDRDAGVACGRCLDRADRCPGRHASAVVAAAGPGRRRRRHHQSIARHDRAQRHAARRFRKGLRLRLFRARRRLVPGAAGVRLPDDGRHSEHHLLDRRRSST